MYNVSNIDPVQCNDMGIKGAHLVVPTLTSSSQRGHHFDLIEHDRNVPYSPTWVHNTVYGSFTKAQWKRRLDATICELSYEQVVCLEIACIAPPRCGNYRSVAEFSDCDPLVCLSASEYLLLLPFHTAGLAPPLRLGLLRIITTPHFVPTKHEIVAPIASPDYRLRVDPNSLLNSNLTLLFVYAIMFSGR